MVDLMLHYEKDIWSIYFYSVYIISPRKSSSVWRRNKMKTSIYKTYEELPLFLNAELMAKVLGIAPSSSYELMHEVDFPVLKVGSRMVVPKEKFIQWVENHTQGGTQ